MLFNVWLLELELQFIYFIITLLKSDYPISSDENFF